MNGRSAFSGATGAPLDIAAIFGARNHYAILGLTPEAEPKEIRHAYRQVSLRIHPDKVQSFLGQGNPELLKDAEAAFKLVSAAYEILSDEGKRAAYDQSFKRSAKSARARTQQQDSSKKPETWVYRAPKKEPEAPPEARENIELRVTHAIYGHEVKLTVGKGISAQLVKKTLSKMVKRGPPDRIEFASVEGVPLDNDFVFSGQQSIFSVGLSLGPPRKVKVEVTDARTGVCRSIGALDTSSLLQVAREVAKVAGVAASEVGVGHFVLVNEDGLTEFQFLDERELLNGRRCLAVKGKACSLLEVSLEEAAAMQDDLIAAYSREDVQRQLEALLSRQASSEALGSAEFHQAFGKVVEESRKDVVTKWGFEGDIAFVQMCRGIHKYEGVEEIHARSLTLGLLLKGVSREAAYFPQGHFESGPSASGEHNPQVLREMNWGDGEGLVASSAEAVDLAPQVDAKKQSSPAADEMLQAEVASRVLAAEEEPEEVRLKRQIWRITGGQDKGGILVREELDLESPFCGERLSYGAFVRELALVYVEGVGERLYFQRLSGSGPEKGWISTALPHKNLAERMWMTEENIRELEKAKPGQAQPWRVVAG